MDEDDSVLKSLLQSCASIRKRSRATKTLTRPNSHTFKRDRKSVNLTVVDCAQQIQEEQRIAESLDRKILEYRAAILRLQKEPPKEQESQSNTANGKAAAKVAARQLKVLRSKLMDETLRKQQEKLLLTRMALAQPAREVAATTTTSSGQQDSDSRDQRILVKETIRCRNKLVKNTLILQRQLDGVGKEMKLVSKEGQQLRTSSQEVWSQLQSLRHQNSERASTGGMAGTEEDRRLVAETVILKRSLADIIAGSDLDWYSDARVLETLMKLE